MSVEKMHITLLTRLNFKRLGREADRELKHKEAMFAIEAGGLGLFVISFFIKFLGG